jgi:hypothetical protein
MFIFMIRSFIIKVLNYPSLQSANRQYCSYCSALRS